MHENHRIPCCCRRPWRPVAFASLDPVAAAIRRPPLPAPDYWLGAVCRSGFAVAGDHPEAAARRPRRSRALLAWQQVTSHLRSVYHALSRSIWAGQVRRLAGVLASNPIDRRGMSNGMTATRPSVCRRADSTPRRCARRPAASVGGPSLAGRFRGRDARDLRLHHRRLPRRRGPDPCAGQAVRAWLRRRAVLRGGRRGPGRGYGRGTALYVAKAGLVVADRRRVPLPVQPSTVRDEPGTPRDST
jgi:hypothetical protein